jgi:biopolymer transport protein ExbB
MVGAWFIKVCVRFIACFLPTLAVAAAILGFERAFLFHRTRLRPEALLAGLKNLLGDGRIEEAIRLCERTPGPLPRVLSCLLRADVDDPRDAESRYLRQAEWEQMLLERHMGTIALVAKLLPAIGCIGTLLALLSCFSITCNLDSYPTVGTFFPAVANAFWMAIFGTLGAVAMNLGYNFLHGRLSNCLREMYSGAEELHSHWLALYRGKRSC